MNIVNFTAIDLHEMNQDFPGTVRCLNSGGVAQGDLVINGAGWVGMRAGSNDSPGGTDGTWLMISESSELLNQQHVAGFTLGSTVNVYEQGQGGIPSAVTVNQGSFYRLRRRASGAIFLDHSDDLAQTWTQSLQLATVSDPLKPLYVRVFANTPGKYARDVIGSN